MYKELSLKITGSVPLILHNGQTADPLNPHTKSIAEITGKTKKTDADHREVARREFYASLYTDEGRVCIPWEMAEALLINGAKKKRRGPDAKAGIIVENNSILEYEGPTSIDELWANEKFRIRVPVIVKRNRVIRTRPIFHNWGLTITVKYLDEMLNPHHIFEFAEDGGKYHGFGDWRPRYGRFTVALQS